MLPAQPPRPVGRTWAAAGPSSGARPHQLYFGKSKCRGSCDHLPSSWPAPALQADSSSGVGPPLLSGCPRGHCSPTKKERGGWGRVKRVCHQSLEHHRPRPLPFLEAGGESGLARDNGRAPCRAETGGQSHSTCDQLALGPRAPHGGRQSGSWEPLKAAVSHDFPLDLRGLGDGVSL